ncbi:16284_t:CDS:2 [Acaulospora morrowiae]|uniref:16284_t:CDS:1 n=1 Tax=Acaulospora morrowiae TaxID=94023 RepID=A0A9N9ET84_9GLOM|nr:16284_t:CDS:2 [Acaulospora morrowiae]
MTQTANQLLAYVVPDCTWIPSGSTASTESAYPRFPNLVREWRYFNRSVNLNRNIPVGQFQVFPTDSQDLSVEDARTRLYSNVLWPVKTLLGGAMFRARGPGILGVPDYTLCTNNPLTAKMPVEIKTRHNLKLNNYNLWEVYRSVDRAQIADQDFRFRKKILSQVFGELACNGLHYGILTNYSDTYFLKRLETEPTTLYVSRVIHPNSNHPTLRDSSKRSSSIQTGSKKKVKTSSSKEITTIDKYIGGGTFGKVFSGYYGCQSVAWKTCDAYKEQEAMKMLKHEAHIYSILKELQGNTIPCLLYEGYIYDGYLYTLALQLIEDARHIDPAILTIEEKESIVKQLESIHSFGVLHNDIALRNILFEPKSHKYFFVDFGLSEIVDDESPKLRKEERGLKNFLHL